VSQQASVTVRPLAFLGAALAATALLLGMVQQPAHATTLPPGFSETTVAGGLNNPTAMAFLPDGRLLVAEQGGKLRMIKNGALLSTAVLTVTVNRTSESGLDGVLVDPAFSTNGYIYIYYTATTPNPHNRVSRFKMVGDTAAASTETVLLDVDDLTSFQHNGGAMKFGRDGKLYVAIGDNYTATNAPSLTSLKGKILRLNPDGTIPADNPFVASTAGKYQSLWAIGLRNPYTFDFQPGTGRMFINDVGEQAWEEINDGIAGSNYGWPATEGYTSDPAYRSPLYAYPHTFDDNGGCAITGGSFYNPTTAQFPSAYVGKYFFVDFCSTWLKTYDPATGAVAMFGSALPSQPLMPTVAPDGSLYYINRIGADGLGVIYKISYTGGLAPVIGSQPQDQLASVGHTATFAVSATGNDPLAYQWYRNGAVVAGATSPSYTTGSLTMADNGATFSVVVSNASGQATSRAALLTLTADQPPTVTITAPDAGVLWRAGQTITYAGTATDAEDGALAAGAYRWTVDFGHRTHFHPFVAPVSGTGGTFTIPTTGETDDQIYYRITLSATDSAGLTSTTYRDIFPQKATITLDSTPTGLVVMLDGTPHTAPFSTLAVVGLQREVGVVSPQTLNGTNYTFASWSDSGAATHVISAPAADTTYRATFAGAVSGSISAAPNPIQVCSGTTGVTNVTWTATNTTSVEVHLNAPDGPTFAVAGAGTETRATGNWVGNGMTFFLQNTSGGLPLTAANTLGKVVVATTADGCPATGSVSANPALLPVCDGSGLGVTMLGWTSTGTTKVEVHIGSPTGNTFAVTGAGAQSATTGKWVLDGMTFYLQNTSGGLPLTAANTLGTVVVHTTRTGCPPGGIAAGPNPIQVCDASGLGATRITWDSNSTVKKVEVHLNAPNGPKFAASAAGPQALMTGKWVTDGMVFYLQNTSGSLPLTAANTLATVTVRHTNAGCTPTGTITAGPNPILVCDGSGVGVTTVSWSSSGTTSVEVHLNAPDGPTFATSGPGSRSATTGKWVPNGMVFYLQNTSGGLPLTAANTLAKVTVNVSTSGCTALGI
jgi:glucose/arabinose dehydrogenase